MLITCPSCASGYDLPADRIGPAGRTVRCAACRESWFVAAPQPGTGGNLPLLEPVAEPPALVIVSRPAPPVSPSDEGGDEAPIRSGRSKRRTGASRRRGGAPGDRLLSRGLAAACVVAAVGAAAVLVGGRQTIVTHMPGTASLYEALGMPVNLVGLSFANVRSTLATESGTQVLEVTGEIRNDGRAARAVPSLLISLEGERGEALYNWSAKAAEGELAVGRAAPFRVRLTAPPPATRTIEVTFRDDGPTRSAAAY